MLVIPRIISMLLANPSLDDSSSLARRSLIASPLVFTDSKAKDKKKIQWDRELFFNFFFFNHASWYEMKIYSRLMFFTNMAHMISEIKKEDRRKKDFKKTRWSLHSLNRQSHDDFSEDEWARSSEAARD